MSKKRNTSRKHMGSSIDDFLKEEGIFEETQAPGNGKFMKKLSRKQARELAAVARLADEKIDLTDAPEIRSWRGAVVGKFYRPIKRPVTIRVDADILAWLKREGRGYQTRINALLRQAMEGLAERALRRKKGR